MNWAKVIENLRAQAGEIVSKHQKGLLGDVDNQKSMNNRAALLIAMSRMYGVRRGPL